MSQDCRQSGMQYKNLQNTRLFHPHLLPYSPGEQVSLNPSKVFLNAKCYFDDCFLLFLVLYKYCLVLFSFFPFGEENQKGIFLSNRKVLFVKQGVTRKDLDIGNTLRTCISMLHFRVWYSTKVLVLKDLAGNMQSCLRYWNQPTDKSGLTSRIYLKSSFPQAGEMGSRSLTENEFGQKTY